jgi:uroporphyrinogen-III synthase
MGNLMGITVAVTADRRREEQALLLERAGFEVVMFPLLRTEAAGTVQLRALTQQLCKCPPEYLVANTGYGMRRWFAGAAEWGLLSDLTGALAAKTKVLARGAKALGELRRIGLDAMYKAPGETLAEIVERLLQEEVAGKQVAVQLHGEAAWAELRPLERAGAKLAFLSVYTMASTACDDGGSPATALARVIMNGSVDAVTFTAAPQVQALFAGSDRQQLLSAFNGRGVVAACVGPVCAGVSRTLGIESPLVPPHPRLGSLVTTLAAHFARS